MRAFIAIGLPAEISTALSGLQDGLKTNLPKISWVKAQNLHLTLKFLGESSPRRVEEVKRIIAETGRQIHPFKIKLDELGVFPDMRRPRIVWAGISEDEALKQLAALLETKLAGIGIAKEKRDFSSHITIARIRRPINPAELEEELNKTKHGLKEAALEFTARQITLFESVLGAGDPVYTVVKNASLNIT